MSAGGLPAVAARLAWVADSLAPGERSGMPPAPAPLERTEGAPWVWRSGQALRSRVAADRLAAAERLAQALIDDPDLKSARALPSGFVELTLSAAALQRLVGALATGAGLPSALDAPPPEPGRDVIRFEAARRAGGAPPLPVQVLTRRLVANPVVAVQLAHARAARWPASVHGRDPAAHSSSRTTADLVTELLDASRRLAQHRRRPQEVTGALEGVAAAYRAWEAEPVAAAARPPEPGRALPGPVVVAAATRVVLERGLALLGVHAPARM